METDDPIEQVLVLIHKEAVSSADTAGLMCTDELLYEDGYCDSRDSQESEDVENSAVSLGAGTPGCSHASTDRYEEASIPEIHPGALCVLTLDEVVEEAVFLQWMAEYLGFSVTDLYINLNVYTRVTASYIEALYQSFKLSYALPHIAALPPWGPVERGLLVYIPGQKIRLFPYVGDVPYARLSDDCTWEYLCSLRQGIACGSVSYVGYGRTLDAVRPEDADASTHEVHPLPPSLETAQEREKQHVLARREVEQCLLNLERRRRESRIAGPPLIRKKARPPAPNPRPLPVSSTEHLRKRTRYMVSHELPKMEVCESDDESEGESENKGEGEGEGEGEDYDWMTMDNILM